MTTDQKGAIAEAAVACEAIKLGVGVFRPLTDERYDLIFDVRPRLRIQCKWATRRGAVMTIFCVSSRRTAEGLQRRTYSAEEIDAVAAYCLEIDRCFLIPIELVANRPSIAQEGIVFTGDSVDHCYRCLSFQWHEVSTTSR